MSADAYDWTLPLPAVIPDEIDDEWTNGDPDKASEIYGIPIFRYGSLLPGFMDILQVEPTDNRDRNLTADEAAKMLGMKKSWLYRHSGELPFTRRLSRRAVRFSEKGIRRWLETRRNGRQPQEAKGTRS